VVDDQLTAMLLQERSSKTIAGLPNVMKATRTGRKSIYSAAGQLAVVGPLAYSFLHGGIRNPFNNALFLRV
jgi:hypothetical protein